MNKVIIAGNLTRDPELKALPSGQNVCNFSIATNRSYKDKNGQRVDQAEYHNIVAFGSQADLIAKWMKKGSYAIVEGRLQTRSWEKDNVKQYRTEIVADRVEFGPKSGGGSGGGGAPSRSSAPEDDMPANNSGIDYPKEEINPDDIPF